MALYNTDQVAELVRKEAALQGVPPELAVALLKAENSGFDKDGKITTRQQIDTETVSGKNARGVMQVIPETVAGLVNTGYLSANTDLNSVEGQVKAGIATIKEARDRGITSPMEQAAYYNGGQAALNTFRVNKGNLNGETAGYLRKVAFHLGGSVDDETSTDSSTGSTGNTTSTTSSRTGTSSTRRTLPPEIADSLITKNNQVSALNATNIAQLQTLVQGILGNADTTKTAIDSSATAKTEVDKLALQKAGIEQDSKNNVLSAAGINLNDSNNILAKNMETITRNNAERTELSTQITALKSKDMLTDPVGWLMDSVKQLPLIARHNALLVERNNAIGNIEQAQRIATNQTAIQPANLKNVYNDMALASANQNYAAASLEKAKVTGVAQAQVANTIIHQSNLAGEDFTKDLRLGELLGTSTTVSTMEGEKESQSDKDAQQLLDRVNLVQRSMGLPAFNKLTFSMLDKDKKQLLLDAAMFSPKSQEGSFRIGKTPSEAVSYIYSTWGTNGLQSMQEQAPAAAQLYTHIIRQGEATATALKNAAALNPGGQEAHILKGAKNDREVIEEGIKKWTDKIEKEVEPKNNYLGLSTDNPYKLQYQVAGSRKELAGNPYGQFAAAQQKQAPGVKLDDTVMLTKALADITTGKQDVGTVAKNLQEFYVKGTTAQYTDMRMNQFGFKPIESYPVATAIYTLQSRPVNLFSRESIENFLVQQVAASKSVNREGTFGTGFGGFR
jgi:hypothetical protein